MTTSADPAATPADPAPSDSAELWRAIGRLEGIATALLEGQRELKEGQRELRADLDTGLRQAKADLDTGLRELRADLDTGLRELRADLDTGQREAKADLGTGLREVNRRIDRLFYAILAVGGALLVSVFASRFIEG